MSKPESDCAHRDRGDRECGPGNDEMCLPSPSIKSTSDTGIVNGPKPGYDSASVYFKCDAVALTAACKIRAIHMNEAVDNNRLKDLYVAKNPALILQPEDHAYG